jgi:hypothetical protein
MSDLEDQGSRPKFSPVRITEDVVAAVLSALILATSTGVGWLVINLPNRLQQLEQQMTQILKNQDAFSERFLDVEKNVNDLYRRVIQLESKK